jgi:hypothetical protein
MGRSNYGCKACRFPLRANDNWTFTCMNPKCERIGVIASAAMTMQVGELEAWLRHYNLGLSVSFAKSLYNAELRRPVGDGSSVAITAAEGTEFSSAVISACKIFEEEHVHTT